MEREFLAKYSSAYAANRRAAVALAIALWTFYYSWDLYHGSNNPEFTPYLGLVLGLRTVGLLFLSIPVVAAKAGPMPTNEGLGLDDREDLQD